MRRAKLLLAGLLALLLQLQGVPALQNPLLEGAHPFLTFVDDTAYLLITRHYDIALYKTTNLNKLDSVTPYRAFCFDYANFGFLDAWWIWDFGEIWAPELHKVNGKWYIYATGWHQRLVPVKNATTGDIIGGEPLPSGQGLPPARQFVMESQTNSPDGPYKLSNYLDIRNGTHGTVFNWRGKYYYAWAEGGPVKTCLKLAPMCNATAVGAPRVTISCPKYGWEKVGYAVNESPAAFKHGGKLFLAYSASDYMTPDYAVGLLTFKGGDILDPTRWEKSSEPVFVSNEAANAYGPGNPSIVQSPDGNWLLAYHAKNTSTTIGLHDVNGTHWASNYKVNVKRLKWVDGRPNFGVPVKPRFTGERYIFARNKYPNGTELACPNYPWQNATLAPTYSC